MFRITRKRRFVLPQLSDTFVCPLHFFTAVRRSPFQTINHFPLYVNAINVEYVFLMFSRNKQEVRIKRQRKKPLFHIYLYCWSKYLRIRLFFRMKQKKIFKLQHDDTLDAVRTDDTKSVWYDEWWCFPIEKPPKFGWCFLCSFK